MGVGMGMSTMGNMMNGFTQMAQNNRSAGMNAPGNGAAGMAAGVASGATQQEDASGWTCECGQKNTGKFCSNCGKPMPQEITEWTCECGQKIQVDSAVIVENQEHKMLQSCNLCVKIFESRTNVGVWQTHTGHFGGN